MDALTDRLGNALRCGGGEDEEENLNKPDFRETQLDLASPVSTLCSTRPSQLGANPTTTTTTTTTTSTSSSSSGSVSARHNGHTPGTNFPRRSDNRSHSGELSGGSSTGQLHARSRHVRSNSWGSHQLIYSGGGGSTSVNSPPANVLPSGNIYPSGRILKTGMMSNRTSKTDVLGSGTVNYGHGSIMRSGAVAGAERMSSTSSSNSDPEELKRVGNENYRKGHFLEALSFYDKAISLSPGNAAYHCNRAAALMGLKRLPEAVEECEKAIKLDPGYVRAHHRLGSLFLSLGRVESARRHLCLPGHQADPVELQKMQAVEKHLSKCADSRRAVDWRSVMMEIDAAMAAGADACPQLFACKAEALLKLRQLDDAILSLSNMPRFEPATASNFPSKFFGMVSDAYTSFVRAQIELTQGRFENALTAIKKAGSIDPRNVEVSALLDKLRMVAQARSRGNDLFKSERFTEACSAYAEGLKLDPSNSVLNCNRAACWYKLGQWERSLNDCNQALRLQPNYTKALLRRAATNGKLERWAEALRDYEILRKQLPNDNEIAEQLFHAQVALKRSRGEDVHNMKFGGEVELILGLEQFRAAISSPSTSVVQFKAASSVQCKQISSFLDTLCARYPSVNFLKVDVEESPVIANAENVRTVPTFKIYIKGSRVKEMVCPSPEVLEASVRQYSI